MPRLRLSALAFCLGFACHSHADALRQGFQNPPASARPLVWWYWLNGNVTLPGIDRDLEWMQRIGLGGFQLFDGNLGTPTLVDSPRLFLSPPWQQAVEHSAKRAAQLGLEMSIATSAGWSAAGGPWVTADDAMKKLVWSSMRLDANAMRPVALPSPPDVAGPFQQVVGGAPGLAPYYRDVKVLAWPVPTDDQPLPTAHLSFSASGVDTQALLLGNLAHPQALAFSADDSAWVQLDYDQPQTVRAVTLGLPARTGFGAPPAAMAQLQAAGPQEGQWTTLADLPPTTSPQRTVSFPAVTARRFRVLLSPAQQAPGEALPQPAKGVIGLSFGPPVRSYPLASLTLHGAARVNHAEEQAGFAVTRDYYAVATPAADSGSSVPRAQVLDLTRYLNADGRLDWTPATGQWQVLRLGYSLTGHQNGPAVPQGTGLEVDKLAAGPVKRYLDHYLELYRSSLDRQATGLKGLLADSIESGPQNWTADMLEQFRTLRGYDPLPWLPALTGTVVDNAAATDRFLFDWRATLAQLLETQYYQTVAQVAHERGLKFYSEALEDNRPQLGNDLGMRRYSDVPMGALWALPAQGDGRATYLADVLGAASIAHLQGKPRVGAESFGAFLQPWAFSPRDLKRTADMELSLGVNLFNIHTSAHQPLERKPGLSLAPFLGQYFNRHETWGEQAGAWIHYLARSAYLLQQGRSQADVLYFIGEEAPLTALFGQGLPADLPHGYGVDFIDAQSLQTLISVHDQHLTTAGGQRYRLLYLGGSSRRMTLATLQQLARLVRDGATLAGSRPTDSPSLADDPAQWTQLADSLWPENAPASFKVGNGQVLRDASPAQALATVNLAKDLSVDPANNAIRFQHRVLADGKQVYFIHNDGQQPATQATFRVTGLKPSAWDADTGKTQALPFHRDDQGTTVTLNLAAGDAQFVVFANEAGTKAPAIIDREPLTGTWRIDFADTDGKPVHQVSNALTSWTDSPLPGLKYFSGTVRYSLQLDRAAACPAHCSLDLGDVRDLAQVTLNGHALGVLWKPPYVIGLPLRKGSNTLEVAVTNPWMNRIIGDAQPGATPVLSGTEHVYAADAPLRPAGLLGPVQLLHLR